jgi:uncharacterized cupredoxin-like copper-binding protein
MTSLPARIQRHPLSAGAALPLIAVLAFAGCGGGDDNGGGSSSKKSSAPASKPASGGTAVSETETDFKFSDPKPTVKSGTVTFNVKNSGATTHALEVEGPKEEVQSGDISPGQSKTVKVKLPPGKYEFYCPVDGHKKLGMKGEVTVK